VVSAQPTAAGPADAVRVQLSELCGSDDVADWAMLAPVLEAFVEGSSERLDELVDAVGRSSVADVEFLSHRLKGSALTLGLSDLAHVCGRLESDARAGVVDSSGLLAQALVLELREAVDAVQQVRGTLPEELRRPLPATAGRAGERPPAASPAPDDRRRRAMTPAAPVRNWSGNVVFRAERSHRPTSIAELQAVVAGA
jgi:HPt (histidine-containing phosphotransfer) domain-containing protein